MVNIDRHATFIFHNLSVNRAFIFPQQVARKVVNQVMYIVYDGICGLACYHHNIFVHVRKPTGIISLFPITLRTSCTAPVAERLRALFITRSPHRCDWCRFEPRTGHI